MKNRKTKPAVITAAVLIIILAAVYFTVFLLAKQKKIFINRWFVNEEKNTVGVDVSSYQAEIDMEELKAQNIRFVFISPPELKVPDYITEILTAKNIPFEEVIRLDDVIPNLDLLYMTRVQRERFFNEEDYVRLKDFYILDKEKLSLAKKDMHILHPLPRVNEISVDVDDDPRAAYFPQVQYGLFVRMALILTLLDMTDDHMNHGLLKWDMP